MLTVAVVARDKFSTLPEMCSCLFECLDNSDSMIICDSGYPSEILDKVKIQSNTAAAQIGFLDVELHSGVNAAWNKAVSGVRDGIVMQIENDAFVAKDVIRRTKEFYEGGGHGIYVPIVLEVDERVHFWPVEARIEHDDVKNKVEFKLDRGRSDTIESCRANGRIDLFERHCFAIDSTSLKKLGQLDEDMICRTDIDISIQAKIADIPVTLDPQSVVTFNNIYDMMLDGAFADFRWNISRVAASHARLLKKWNIIGYKNSIIHAFEIRKKLFGEITEPKDIVQLGF